MGRRSQLRRELETNDAIHIRFSALQMAAFMIMGTRRVIRSSARLRPSTLPTFFIHSKCLYCVRCDILDPCGFEVAPLFADPV